MNSNIRTVMQWLLTFEFLVHSWCHIINSSLNFFYRVSGLTEKELENLASPKSRVMKISRRDLTPAIAKVLLNVSVSLV